MHTERTTDVETIQKMIARVVATHPAGRNLLLIGGFRYRFLDSSVRISNDIDYHWTGDLQEKQKDLIELFNRILLPEVRRLLQYEGVTTANYGTDADSLAVSTINLAFWRVGVAYSRIEIPVEITKIVCADDITIRTVNGTIYATVSDADMIESKIIALLNRTVLQHRDIVDLFLFQESFLSESGKRLKAKIDALMIPHKRIKKRMADLQEHQDYHAKAVQAIIDTQLDAVIADQMNDAGGGKMVFSTVLKIIIDIIRVYNESD